MNIKLELMIFFSLNICSETINMFARPFLANTSMTSVNKLSILIDSLLFHHINQKFSERIKLTSITSN